MKADWTIPGCTTKRCCQKFNKHNQGTLQVALCLCLWHYVAPVFVWDTCFAKLSLIKAQSSRPEANVNNDELDTSVLPDAFQRAHELSLMFAVSKQKDIASPNSAEWKLFDELVPYELRENQSFHCDFIFTKWIIF